MMIYTENFPGNMHTSAVAINKRGLAEYLIQMDTMSSGSGTVAAFRVSDELYEELTKDWIKEGG